MAINPTSRFGAVKLVVGPKLDNNRTAVEIATPPLVTVELGGSDSNTAGGTVKVRAAAGARQVK